MLGLGPRSPWEGRPRWMARVGAGAGGGVGSEPDGATQQPQQQEQQPSQEQQEQLQAEAPGAVEAVAEQQPATET